MPYGAVSMLGRGARASAFARPMLRLVFLTALVLTSCQAAVIAVTAGGGVAEPTYQFSDISGTSVAKFHANVSDGTIHTASTVHGPGLAVSNAPVNSLLTITGCSTSGTDQDAGNCAASYDGDEGTLWWNTGAYDATSPGTQSPVWYQLFLSSASTVTRIVFTQMINWHPRMMAPRVIIEFYDASDALLWKKTHDCLAVHGRPWGFEEDVFLFPFVAEVSKIQFTFHGWSYESDNVNHLTRGFREIKIYGA